VEPSIKKFIEIGDEIEHDCRSCQVAKKFKVEEFSGEENKRYHFKITGTRVAIGHCPTCNKKISKIVAKKRRETLKPKKPEKQKEVNPEPVAKKLKIS
jgi:hypothetical protein